MAKKTGGESLGRNVEYKEEGSKLILTIDLKAKTELSKSKKTLIVATTAGNKRIGDWFLGLNLYRYATPK